MINPVERFLNYLTVEKGLSANTLEAYKNDIYQFGSFLEKNNKEITGFDKKDLVSYLTHLRDSGKQTATITRNIS
ncbi:MAG: site-specific integrase, partial [Nitrospirae bacterium]|nr:site-specific integrase [Nitrospirota bacterium]